MAYLSPIPRRRDRKGAGTARILALLGRAGLAEMQRRKSVREAAQKAAQEAEKIAYERGKDARAEGRAERTLGIREEEHGYDVSQRPEKEAKAKADRLWEEKRRAHEEGDWKREAELDGLLAQMRRQTIAKNEKGDDSGGGGTQYDRGIALLEDLFVKNPVAPEQMPGRIPRILKLRAPGTKSPEDLAKLRETILYGLKPSPEDTEKGLEPIGPGIDTTYADDPRISKWVDQWLMKYADVLGIERGAFLAPSKMSGASYGTAPQGDPRQSFTTGMDDLDTLIDEELGP